MNPQEAGLETWIAEQPKTYTHTYTCLGCKKEFTETVVAEKTFTSGRAWTPKVAYCANCAISIIRTNSPPLRSWWNKVVGGNV